MNQIGYPYLVEDYGKEAIDGITDLISGILASSKPAIPIAGENMPSSHVKKRFETLNMFHIQYVLDCMRNNTSKVRNIRQYLITALYNAPSTMTYYYSSEVNHGMYGG